MKEQKKLKAKVTGKWIKGTIWKRPHLSLEFVENMNPKYYDLPVKMAFWNAVKKGTHVVITIELDDDGLWYVI